MKIAVIGGRGFLSRYSGIEVSIHETASRLAAAGHRITVYCRGKRNDPSEGEVHPNIVLIYLPTIESKHLGTFIHTFFSALHACFSDVEVVHFHALGPALFVFLPKLFRKKTVVTIHGLDWKRKKWKFLARVFLRLCEYPALYIPERTIVVSLVLKNYFETKFKKPVLFIPNGVTVSKGDNLMSGQGENPAYILFVGRLVPEKRIEDLIGVFCRIHSGLRLVIAGTASFTDRYAAGLRAMADDTVEFLGFVGKDALEELYRNAYLFVLPSEVEGAPVSLLEAMNFGRCILASDIPELRELVDDCGLFFQTGNPCDLEAKLRYLISNPGFVASAGIKARSRVQKYYSWDAIAKTTEQHYESL